MGSWNATCNISNLPICSGDEVRLLFMTKGPYSLDKADNAKEFSEYNSREGCYQNSFWFPRMIPLKAVYSDCGDVDDLEKSLLTDYFWRQLETDVVAVEKGENKYHDPSFSLEDVKNRDFERLMWTSGEGRLRVNSRYNDYEMDGNIKDFLAREKTKKPAPPVANPCTHVFILDEVWEAMFNTKSDVEMYDYKNKGTIKSDSYYNYYLEAFTNYYETSILEMKGMDQEKRSWHRMISSIDRIVSQTLHVPFMQGVEFYLKTVIEDVLSQKLDYTKDELRIKEVLTRLSEVCAINDIYSVIRKSWTLQGGCGSQSSNYRETANFHQKMADIGAKYARKQEVEQQQWEEEELLYSQNQEDE